MTNSHWNSYWASWSHVRSPLRPCEEDIENFSKIQSDLPPNPKILLLGLTSEILAMQWPEGSEIYAVDHSENAIKGLWHISKIKNSHAIRASWLELPFHDHFFDLIIGDGIGILLEFSEALPCALSEFKRVLSQNGKMTLRHFTRIDEPENTISIFTKAQKGEIPNFSVFKWLLAHSLQKNTKEGVRVSAILDEWDSQKEQFKEFQWPMEDLKTIEIYKNSPAIYHFMTASELVSVFSEYFEETNVFYGNYVLGDLCPIVFYNVKK